MDRRAFIAGTAGGVLAAGHLAAAPHSGAGTGNTRIATYVTNLRDHRGAAGLPAPGATVALQRVWDRAYDAHSIGVLAEDGRLLGFLPPAHGQVIAPLMDAGLTFAATVTERADGRSPRLSLELGPTALATQT